MSGRPWLAQEVKTLRRLYPHHETTWVAEQLDRSVFAIYGMVDKLGLHKTPAYLAATLKTLGDKLVHSGHSHRFPKGLVPWNKGRKGWCPEASRASQFKKGHKPHTWKPVGSYRINADGYLDRKVSDTGYPPRDWVGVHRLVWMERHGPIPKGRVVRFKPGCRTTDVELITIDKLECISLQENMRRNTVHNLPKPIVRAVQLRGALVRQINRRARDGEQHR